MAMASSQYNPSIQYTHALVVQLG